MDAAQTCETLLSLVKKSNLNFSLSESPFSVSMTIKKTFIKNIDGSSRVSNISPGAWLGEPVSSSPLNQLIAKNYELEIKIKALEASAAVNVRNFDAALNQKVSNLESLQHKPKELDQTIASTTTNISSSLSPSIQVIQTKITSRLLASANIPKQYSP